ncbi:small multi-drug export protein [Paenibacillus piri]|uniref:Small multi-drug export protein n=1 Tax=Paenibacillus piri TaxID=2547395 RepID=A0A4R5KUX7_9BACL|nr:small multi-drug export protein [Paenibacillus piri]TDF98885.1 small multi-drug export protein [Paenibacillus piri]
MSPTAAWFSVFAAGILELWAAIPLGFTLQLPPVATGICSALGSIVAAAVIIFFGKSFRNWLVQRFQRKNERKETTMSRVWKKYGIIGLGFLSPLLTGSPLGAAIGVSLGAEPRRLMLWMTLGIVFWSAVLTTALALGIMSYTSFI